jgi:hypothetical protein
MIVSGNPAHLAAEGPRGQVLGLGGGRSCTATFHAKLPMKGEVKVMARPLRIEFPGAGNPGGDVGYLLTYHFEAISRLLANNK